MTSCECPDPPGGSVTCEMSQLAICDAEHGARCCTPPTALSVNTPEFDNWALSIITGRRRDPDQPISDADHRTLRSGRYLRPNGTTVIFSLPRAAGAGMVFAASD